MSVAHPWNVFAREISKSWFDCKEASISDSQSSDDENSVRSSSMLLVRPLSENFTRVVDNDADPAAEVSLNDKGFASMGIVDSVTTKKETCSCDDALRMEARLCKAQRRHSELQKRISVLETQAKCTSSNLVFSTGSACTDSQLIRDTWTKSYREGVVSQLDRHNRLGVAEVALQGVAGKLAHLQEELSRLRGKSAHQERSACHPRNLCIAGTVVDMEEVRPMTVLRCAALRRGRRKIYKTVNDSNRSIPPEADIKLKENGIAHGVKGSNIAGFIC